MSGITHKTNEKLTAMIDNIRKSHLKVFGTVLTKKEATAIVDHALEKKRQEWLKGCLMDHSIDELNRMKIVIKEAK